MLRRFIVITLVLLITITACTPSAVATAVTPASVATKSPVPTAVQTALAKQKGLIFVEFFAVT